MKALVFGEVLWDVFPEYKALGGAPMNFCAHFSKLGGEGYLISAVGDDELGVEALENIKKFGIPDNYIMINKQKPTGYVSVTLDENHQPTYEIVKDVAYDNIMLADTDIKSINDHAFDVLYFGTLAQRNSVSADTLDKITDNCKFKEIFCDINIRQSFYSKELIVKSFEKSTIIKINRDECDLVKEMGIADGNGIEEICADLCDKYNFNVVIVTLDSDGAAAYSSADKKLYTAERQPATPVSAVGAGDSFSGCFLYNYIAGVDVKSCIERANIVGAYVVSSPEAIPEYTEELLKKAKGC